MFTATIAPVSGLTFYPDTRMLTGTPTTAGNYRLNYVQPPTLMFTATIAALTYTENTAVNALTLPPATDGTPPYLYKLHPTAGEVAPNPDGTITPVPGLTFAPGTRMLTGTPAMAGSYHLTYTATDAAGTAINQQFTITVANAPAPPDSGGGGVDPDPDPPAQAVSCPTSTSTDPTETQYSITFQANWSRSNFPTNFPGGAHFSPLVGAVHDSMNEFWSPNNPASTGIENMAEFGGTRTLVAEINAVTPTTSYTGSGIGSGTGTTSISFRVSQDCPLVTFVSMVAPSHDWFVGVTGKDLRDGSNQFVDKTINLPVWDAGTEDGTNFSLSGTADTNPQGIIELLTTDSTATDFMQGTNQNVYIGTFTFTVIQAATAALPRLTAAPATIAEGGTSTVTVALAKAAPAGGMPLTLTFGGTAGGDDYRASAARVTIPAGATTTTFTITALSDEIADPVETIIITANGASTPVTTTVTIQEESATANQLNRVILPEVARAIADHGLQAVAGRIEQAGSGANAPAHGALGGHATLAAALRTHGQAIAEGATNLNTLLDDSNFVLPLDGDATDRAGDDSPRRVTLWGGTDYRNLDGSGGADGADGAVDWDGHLLGAHIGADAHLRRDLLAGLMVSWNEGKFDYRLGDGRGDYELNLTAVHPYLGRTTRDGMLELWATAGYGWGNLAITDDDNAQKRGASDVEMRSVGVGGSRLLSANGARTVRLKGELMQAKIDVEGSNTAGGGLAINPLEVRSGRARLALAANLRRDLPGGAQLLRSAEVGARYDGGHGETGGGAEVGLGVRYSNPAGLNAGGNLRALAGRDDYHEWGVQGRVRLLPGKDGQGISFSLNPVYGIIASGATAIWERGLPDHGDDGGQLGRGQRGQGQPGHGARIETELGYGITTGNGLLTPYSRLTLTDRIDTAEHARTWRLGGRLESDSRLNLNLEGYRHDGNGEPTEYGIALQADLYW